MDHLKLIKIFVGEKETQAGHIRLLREMWPLHSVERLNWEGKTLCRSNLLHRWCLPISEKQRLADCWWHREIHQCSEFLHLLHLEGMKYSAEETLVITLIRSSVTMQGIIVHFDRNLPAGIIDRNLHTVPENLVGVLKTLRHYHNCALLVQCQRIHQRDPSWHLCPKNVKMVYVSLFL